MAKTIAEMRAAGTASLPERVIPMCLNQALIAEAQSLEQERATLPTPAPTDDEGEPSGPQKMVQPQLTRRDEIDARRSEIDDEMREYTGELRLRGVPAGEWRRWADDNPAREDSTVDELVGYGLVNSSALLGRLGDFAAAWNGTPLADGEWDYIASVAAPGDLKEVCRQVVAMHEAEGMRPKGSPKSSSKTASSATSSTSPAA